MEAYLRPTPFMNSDHPAVAGFAALHAGNTHDPLKQAINLYYGVRDGIYYDPYSIVLTVEGLRADTTLTNSWGWCVTKSILLGACCRAMGIPARLGFADVKNHLSTERLRKQMKTDIFYWHGYTDIYLEGVWRKATPAFNIELCEKFSLKSLEFDGRSDSIYHPFDLEGNRHMEYVHSRGEYADVPLEAILHTFQARYPGYGDSLASADFANDVALETRRPR